MPESAISAYDRALSFNQYSLEALNGIANVLRAEDKYAEAAKYIEVMLQIEPNTGENWSSLGICLFLESLIAAFLPSNFSA